MLTTLFLSFALADQAAVESLYRRLKAAGFQPWMASRDILAGEDVRRSTERALRGAAFVLVCLTRASVDQRGALQREIKQAVDRRQELLDDDIFLIPVRLEPCLLPDSLSGLWPVDLYEPDGFERLAAALQAGLAKRQELTGSQQGGEISHLGADTPQETGTSPTQQEPMIPPALSDAWQRGRLAIIWGATPFELAAGPLTRLVAVRRWQALAHSLPAADLGLPADALPVAPILSLDPSNRLLDLFREQRIRVSVVRGPDEVVKPGEHGYYPLAGDLVSQERLVLTQQDIRDIWQDDVKRRWMWEPWLRAARAGVVLLLGADPSSSTFHAWWDELLGPALQGVAVYAVGAPAGWPAGIVPVDAALLTDPASLRSRQKETEPMSIKSGPPQPPSDSEPSPTPVVQTPTRARLYPSQIRNLETKLAELEKEHDTLSRRISAVSVDIGRTLDSMDRQILEERKTELAGKRDQVSQEMADIEAQLEAGR